MCGAVLRVRGLRTVFPTEFGEFPAADGVDLDLREGEILGIVGESGSGKSITGLSVLRLVPPPGVIAAGEIRFNGRDLLALTEAEMRRVRSGMIAMVFQDPMSSLNPYLRVGEQIAEVVRIHLGFSRRKAKMQAVKMLERVGIADPGRRAENYPHQLSGGMRQRVMIASALAGKPKLVIADEPTTALDVTIQAQILALLRTLVHEQGASMVLITHDFGVIAAMADTVSVMYAGRVMESASASQILANPRHPYTRSLLKSIPDRSRRGTRLFQLSDPPTQALKVDRRGCPFATRCPEAFANCHKAIPPTRAIQRGHTAYCWIESNG